MVITANRDIDRGLVLHLPLTEGSGSKVWDRSKYGNHGDITFGGGGAAAFWANSRLGKPVATFDALADYINVPDSPSLNPTSEITVAAWVYQKSDPAAQFKYFVGKGTNYYHEPYILSATQDPVWKFSIWDGVNAQSVSASRILNEWHHLAGVFGGTYLKILVDGKEKHISTFSSQTIAVEAHDVTIGACDTPARYVDTYMYDARIYDRALTEQEIKILANQRRRF